MSAFPGDPSQDVWARLRRAEDDIAALRAELNKARLDDKESESAAQRTVMRFEKEQAEKLGEIRTTVARIEEQQKSNTAKIDRLETWGLRFLAAFATTVAGFLYTFFTKGALK